MTVYNYRPVDVFICMECGRFAAVRKGLAYAPGHAVPHCCGVKTGYIDTMPRSTYAGRARQAADNWRAFKDSDAMGRRARRIKHPGEVRKAYGLGVA